MKIYTVYNNKTDELVALDLSSHKCAEAMGLSYKGFRSAVSRAKSGKVKKWYIEVRKKDKK